jgi:hypothetical protein
VAVVTVHLISVGLSVREALEKPRAKLGDRHDLIRVIQDERPHELLARAGIPDGPGYGDQASGWLVSALAADGEHGRDPVNAGRLVELAARIHPQLWPEDFSAEIETFARAQRTGRWLPDKDVAILICSDTPRGLLAGVWNAVALTRGDLARVRYLPHPDAPLRTGREATVRGRAILVRVPGMDAGNEAGFRQAMRGLGLLARHLFESGGLKKNELFRFCLSGGFKAATPYLIGMAEAVRSVDLKCLRDLDAGALMPDEGTWQVEAFVLHETAGPEGPPIRLPLRLLDADAVRYELAGFDADRFRPGMPSPALLNGYAYEATGLRGPKACKLTAFGEGLREFFGVPYEGFGR